MTMSTLLGGVWIDCTYCHNGKTENAVAGAVIVKAALFSTYCICPIPGSGVKVEPDAGMQDASGTGP